jgi:hypothetical protein
MVIRLLLILVTIFYSAEGFSSDVDIKRKIIQNSINSYSGNCPCPYSLMRNGRSCGRRSAYSKPGGESPICYESDVTEEMVREYGGR